MEELDEQGSLRILAPNSQPPGSVLANVNDKPSRSERFVQSDSESRDFFVPETQLTQMEELETYPGPIPTANSQQSSYTIENHTLNSLGKQSVLIIKPTDASNKEMIYNPVKFQNVFQKSEFAKHKIKDIRTNIKQNLIVLEFEDPSKIIMSNLLKIKKIGEWEINCSMPNSDKYREGVISPISTEADLEELKGYIEVRDCGVRVIKVDRMQRKTENGWVPSNSVKLTFEGENLPNAITVLHSFFKVRPFIPQPRQCYKCQRIGHLANSCRATLLRCLLCGENHKQTECSKSYENFHCANCSGNHKANSRECPYYNSARKIEVVRAQKNLSYQAARAEVHKESQKSSNLSQAAAPDINSAEGSKGKKLYSQMLVKNPNGLRNVNKTTRDAETQTEKDLTNEITNHPVFNAENNFLEKLKLVLLDVLLSNCIQTGSKTTQVKFIERVMNKHFQNNEPETSNDDETEDDIGVDNLEEEMDAGVLSNGEDNIGSVPKEATKNVQTLGDSSQIFAKNDFIKRGKRKANDNGLPGFQKNKTKKKKSKRN